MSRPFDTRPGGRLDAAFRQAPDLTEADVKATLMPQSCRTCRWWKPLRDQVAVGCTVLVPHWAEPLLWVRKTPPEYGQSCPTWEQRAPDTESRS